MDSGTKHDNPNPRESANPFSRLTFTWMFGLFWKGYKKELNMEDIYNPLANDLSEQLGDELQSKWDHEVERKRKSKGTPSLLDALVNMFFWQYTFLGILAFTKDILLRIGHSIFLGKLLEYFSLDSTLPTEDALLYAAAQVILTCVNVIFNHHYIHGTMRLGMKIRIACCSLIYRKALLLDKTALRQTTVGQIVNLMSNDVNRFDFVAIFVHYLWIGPVMTIVVSFLLWKEAGVSGLLGVTAVLMTLPIEGWLGKLQSKYRLRTAKKTDERLRLMNEIIGGIEAIKMYAWENTFGKLVSEARRNEIKQLKWTAYIRGVYMSFVTFTTRVSVYVSLITLVLFGYELSAEKVFLMTNLYFLLSHVMTMFFPQAIAQVAETKVSIKRIQEFLLYEERCLRVKSVSEKKQASFRQRAGVTVTNASAKWNSTSTENTFSNVTFNVKPGKLVAVIGPVGAGKSSLLHALLDELPLVGGNIEIGGKVSYASQEPWLFVASVRQNILFGQPFDREKYDHVVTVCALKRDFQQFPQGDSTLIGEKGVSLSGGQKARINLARAVYRNADVYLLDDPLSAVDPHVGRHLFEDCISDYLAKKTRILVTHQIQYLRNVDYIVILNNGKVESQGTYTELLGSDKDYAKILTDEDLNEVDERRDSIIKTLRQISVQSKDSEVQPLEEVSKPEEVEESKSSGNVKLSVYLKYFRAGGNYIVVFLVLSSFILGQLASSSADYWSSYWTTQEELRRFYHKSMENGELHMKDANHTVVNLLSTEDCMYIYSGIVASTFVIALVRSFSFFSLCLRSSVNLHHNMFNSIVKTTMRFFHTNPSGRVMNRFSKDMGTLDETLPRIILDSLQMNSSILSSLIIIGIVNYYLLIPVFIMAIIFYLITRIYLPTSRNIKRLEGVARSPVFSHLSASLEGLTTIRAFGAQEMLKKEFDNQQNFHTSAWYMFLATSTAFGFWLDFFCFIYTALVTFAFFVLPGDAFGGEIGLVITRTTLLTGFFQWGIRQTAEVVNQMVSAERILEYTSLPEEPRLMATEDNKPPNNWPSKGLIEFNQMYMNYSELDPPVLQGLNFVIYPAEKVGIVGRTGAGKSSLIAALFRLAKVQGIIKIDGTDTSMIALQELRKKISIIPQNPVLFSGTIRKNLDPFDEFRDSSIWNALEEVELKTAIADMNGLNTQVSEGGSNFSVGQRQLICLARAILRHNKILVLDEATANVDPQTDNLIQQTIRKKFLKCTVLTIAHRLNTIMDSDKVLVMDNGKMVEMNQPYILLNDDSSYFSQMVQQTGKSMSDQLYKIAKQAFLARE